MLRHHLTAMLCCLGSLGVLLAPSAGCVALGDQKGRPLVPDKFLTQTGPYRVWTNEPIAADAPAIRQLSALERQVQSQLGLRVDPKATPLEICILDDSRSFEHFLTFYYPELPSRRAFFLARGDRRVVYTYLGDRLIEDLRHEATHALLNASVPDVLPLWLDEGLAEYFEVPEERGGINAEHLARLPRDLASGWAPDLKRLEGLKDVRNMTPRDYRESWAWVHYLLDGPKPNRAALLGYLADLRTGHDPLPLSARLEAADGPPAARMIAHIDRVRERDRMPADPSLERTHVFRAQDSAPEPLPAPAPTTLRPVPIRRRSFLSRLGDLFRPGP